MKLILSRIAFFIQYYTRKIFSQIKKRAPSLKKLHLESFPAIHIKKMDWMDFVLKFSGELSVLVLSLSVAGLNLFYFTGGTSHEFQDQSLASHFLSRHAQLNPKLYAKNSSIVTVVSTNGFFPQAQADDFTGLDSQGLAFNDSSEAGNSIVMSDENSILAPNPDSIQNQVVNVVKKIYLTQSGDSLKSIAAENGVSVNSIKWSNPNLVGDSIKPGWDLVIPSVDGVAVTADSNTTLPDLAVKYSPQKYNSDKKVRDAAAAQLLETIISYNGLGSAEDINDGDFLIIPGGEVANPPAPKVVIKPKPAITSSGASNAVTSIGSGYDGINHVFPKGYCTYYVATRMKITFGGNAKNWLANARASGYVVSKEPAPRSAVVTTDSARYGHVAYVEEVTATAILVSEMNFERFNKVNQRWIPINSPSIRGYIYP